MSALFPLEAPSRPAHKPPRFVITNSFFAASKGFRFHLRVHESLLDTFTPSCYNLLHTTKSDDGAHISAPTPSKRAAHAGTAAGDKRRNTLPSRRPKGISKDSFGDCRVSTAGRPRYQGLGFVHESEQSGLRKQAGWYHELTARPCIWGRAFLRPFAAKQSCTPSDVLRTLLRVLHAMLREGGGFHKGSFSCKETEKTRHVDVNRKPQSP